jgi:DNA repair photolyase
MIISVSRRTDIPAFYSDWFMNRVREGFVMARNPMNPHQVSQISLSQDVVDCFVFWTKNPQRMLSNLHELDDRGYAYYFQFTLNSYNQKIERHVPRKKTVIDVFKKLSERIGKHKVVWRYDPIIITKETNVEYHIKYFKYLSDQLEGHTDKCIVSFVDLYKKCKRNLKDIKIDVPDEKEKRDLAKMLAGIARDKGITIETCAEDIDFSDNGIAHGKCIDDSLIERITGARIAVKKDKNQREACGCVSSIDIGAYNTCKHNCLYCYANFNTNLVDKNTVNHSSTSPLLIGELKDDDKINDRKMKSLLNRQLSF